MSCSHDGLNRVTEKILRGAFAVHSALGPGLLESAYEHCLAHELSSEGLRVTRQMDLPVHYKGARLDAGYRLDLVVEDMVVVEVKAVVALQAIHSAQVLTYLRLSDRPIGLLLNFNVAHLRVVESAASSIVSMRYNHRSSYTLRSSASLR